MTRAGTRAVAVIVVGLFLCGCSRCDRQPPAPASGDAAAPLTIQRAVDAVTLADGAVESAAELAETTATARRLTAALLADGIAPREVSSVADIHGYRHFRAGRYRQALVWFDAGTRIDASYEPCLFNAARAAALTGDPARAARYLDRLRRLDTPMARRQLARVAQDPALVALPSIK